ncbi:DinB family protein [Marmoricola sp. URHB0036]|uniref:DinB family protein n=1 Tax=Marmoricola sp. URHB0036 TaxID=1298863 RepID=UPI0003F70947|nr:DinB family protein [Marmoricola sp. URHB0036]
MSAITVPWNTQLLEQLDWHWTNHVRPRWGGLTDDEYFWEPVADCWNVRRVGEGSAAVQAGTGEWRCDYAYPEPDPAPVTTIAWRLAHLIVGVFGERCRSHFGGPPISYDDFAYAGSAVDALEQLDAGYARWIEGVRSLEEEGLRRECGPAEGPFAEHPLSELVLHINREAIHHGAEILLLRDLYLRTTPRP